MTYLRSGVRENVDPYLTEALRGLGDSYGPLGVALVAAELTDPNVLVERLGENNRAPIYANPRPSVIDWTFLDDEPRETRVPAAWVGDAFPDEIQPGDTWNGIVQTAESIAVQHREVGRRRGQTETFRAAAGDDLELRGAAKLAAAYLRKIADREYALDAVEVRALPEIAAELDRLTR